MRTRFSRPELLEREPRLLGEEVEEQLNEPFWRWGTLHVRSEPVPEEEGQPVIVGGGPQDPGAPSSSVGGLGVGADMVDPHVRGETLWHIDSRQTIIRILVFSPQETEGSSYQDFLQVRLRNWKRQEWIGSPLSTLERELGPEPREITLRRDYELLSDDTVGGVAMRIGVGPTIYQPPSLRIGVLFVRR